MRNKKRTLQDYFGTLSEKSPKRQMIEKIADECGVSLMTVYRWISGEVVPDKLKKEKIAEITGIAVDELFPIECYD